MAAQKGQIEEDHLVEHQRDGAFGLSAEAGGSGGAVNGAAKRQAQEGAKMISLAEKRASANAAAVAADLRRLADEAEEQQFCGFVAIILREDGSYKDVLFRCPDTPSLIGHMFITMHDLANDSAG